jgi:hypothetical protein
MSVAKKSTAKTDNLLNKLMSADLNGWNKYLALIFALQGVVILILSVNRSYPISTSFLGIDTLQSQAQNNVVLATGVQHLFDVNIAYLIATFFFVAAITHGLVVTKLRSFYERDIKKGLNRIRWIEYALCAGLMIALIGMLVGVEDISTIFLLFGTTAVMSLLGIVVEAQNQGARKVSWASFIVGCSVGALPWVVLAAYLISGGIYGTNAPAFVYWVFGVMLILFAAFPVNTYLIFHKAGKWKDYMFGERMFMILSLVAKTALAWIVFAGSLHP